MSRSGPGRGGDRPPRPLAGRTVLVTRPTDQSTSLVTLLRRLGARAIVAPAIEIVPARSAALTRALRELQRGDFAWMTLTSRATVDMLASRLSGPRALGATRVAAIGDGTAAAFRRWARRDPDLIPATFTTSGLARAFPRGIGRVLCARADIAPVGLEGALAAKGWSPTRVDAYRTRFPRSLPTEARDALRRGEVDAVTFTSASTVRGFVGALGAVKGNPKVVCIGPVTAREARTHGLVVHAVARPHTVEGVAAAVMRALAR
ncbi:MAG TPA: uroporphyrinogen-III synthase [Actinomycetota bacterium]|nr:uroporphyrinogen-III synthase [Actinomycetota bacterium]